MDNMESLQTQLDAFAGRMMAAQELFRGSSVVRAAAGEHVAAISGQMSEIKSALKEIESISMQVKILSLNASVEAARAGAAGKGFAVVASEIGKLSHNTDSTVSKIDGTIDKMCEMLRSASRDMEETKRTDASFDDALDSCVREVKAFKRAE